MAVYTVEKKSLVRINTFLTLEFSHCSYRHRMVHYWKLPQLLFYAVVAKVSQENDACQCTFFRKHKRSETFDSLYWKRSEAKHSYEATSKGRSLCDYRSKSDTRACTHVCVCIYIYIYIPERCGLSDARNDRFSGYRPINTPRHERAGSLNFSPAVAIARSFARDRGESSKQKRRERGCVSRNESPATYLQREIKKTRGN